MTTDAEWREGWEDLRAARNHLATNTKTPHDNLVASRHILLALEKLYRMMMPPSAKRLHD